jgi:DNA-binding beta-propeller fold protein YncE
VTSIGGRPTLLIADSLNNAVRAVDLETNILSTVAGTGAPGFSGDHGPPGGARVDTPRGIAVLPAGDDQDVLIADTFTDRIRLAGTPRLVTTPTPLDFGLVPAGTARDGEVLVTNNGSGMAPSVTPALQQAPAFQLLSSHRPCAVSSLVHGQTCLVDVRFTPAGCGTAAGTLTIDQGPPLPPVLVPLTGKGGCAQIGLSTARLDFDSQPLNLATSRTITVTDTGDEPLHVSNVAVGTGEFAVTSAPTGGCPLRGLHPGARYRMWPHGHVHADAVRTGQRHVDGEQRRRGGWWDREPVRE